MNYFSQLALQLHEFCSIRQKQVSLGKGFQKSPPKGAALGTYKILLLLMFFLLKMRMGCLAVSNYLEHGWEVGPNGGIAGSLKHPG